MSTSLKGTRGTVAQGTEYTYSDGDKATCHSAGQVKRNLNSARKAAVRARCWSIIAAQGKADLDAGYGFCAACGQVGLLLDDSDNDAALELAHDVPDAHDGAYCPCNLAIPMHRRCNKALGDVALTGNLALYFDTRDSWSAYDVTVERFTRPTYGPDAWQVLGHKAQNAADAWHRSRL